MKSLLLKAITLSFITLFTTACTLNVNLDESKENTEQAQEEAKTEKGRKLIGDTPVSDATSYTTALKDNNLLNKVREILNSGNHKLEVTKKPSYELPAGIHDAQIDKYYIIDDVFFALVRKPSMNVPMNLPEGFKANFSGLIAADTTNKEWKKV